MDKEACGTARERACARPRGDKGRLHVSATRTAPSRERPQGHEKTFRKRAVFVTAERLLAARSGSRGDKEGRSHLEKGQFP